MIASAARLETERAFRHGIGLLGSVGLVVIGDPLDLVRLSQTTEHNSH
jgi:hypothetical protein